jgi:ATP-dependent DNA helicase RecG
MLELRTPVQYVKGVGPRLGEALAPKGIATVEDLLYYLPFRYEDRINPRSIEELRPGEMASVIAEVRNSGLFRTRSGKSIFHMVAGQGRARLKSLWFNARYLEGKFEPGQLVALYGKVEQDSRGSGLQIIQPQYEVLADEIGDDGLPATQSLEVGRIVPIYESANQGRLSSKWFRRIIFHVLQQLAEFPETLPVAMRSRLDLIALRQAFWGVHFPHEHTQLPDLQAARTPAHRRLIFEELFFLELGLELKRNTQRAQPGISFRLDEGVRDAFKRILPFRPTGAQKRVLKEIADDMRQAVPMRRLLQGDVGSGKTLVAFEAAIIAIENGYQVALMAPTEILAAQHYLSARRMLEHAGYRIVLLTGSMEQERKRDLRRHLVQGNAQLVIGTHALIQQTVEFARLGLVIVDEQHRFGVLQRFHLMKKGSDAPADPDTLVMTATPIPRTLALTLYGDLDVSVLDEMPPGRSPIVTRRVPDERSPEVWEFVAKQVAAGRQAYVVYPVIEETEESELKAAISMYNKLRRDLLPDAHIGLLHGRMPADEKEDAMRRFQSGQVQVLVSTTVIEVGVDVSNATVMVIEHAERFGLAQLHQLRGRIGRGSAKSFCILITGRKVSEDAEQRLAAMVSTTDGFQLAELDLQLRGPGEFFGTRQAGMPTLRVANLVRDRELLELAKREAASLLIAAPDQVSRNEAETAFKHLRSHWNRRYGLVEVG